MKNNMYYTDALLLLAIVLLSGLSLFMIYSSWSISSIVFGDGTFLGTFGKQLLLVVASMLIYYAASKFPYKCYYKIAYFLWWLSVFLLLYVFTTEEINESRSWIPLPFANFQPSELAKIAVVLSLGRYYYNLKKKSEPMGFNNGILIPFTIVFVPTILVIFQPDPGTALVILGIGAFCFFVSGTKLKFLLRILPKISLIVVALSLFLVTLNFATNGATLRGLINQQSRMISRFNNFKDPCGDYFGDGFQICNSLIAINSGGVTGKGLGNSTQKYLYIPESHTDAIYAVTAEELGFAVVGIVLLIYLFLVLRIMYYAKKTTDKFCQITCVGVASLILLHVFVNVGGIINLIPFTGIPLPFFSYGGTFLMLCAGFMGMLQSIIISIKRDGEI